MFDEVTESVWLPLYDFDFWSLPYLSGKGVSVQELTGPLRTTQELIGGRRHGIPPERMAALDARLAEQIAALRVAPSRFTW